jgi:hypothetical protein
MSIAFDSFWWWRAEFDGRPNPYQALAAPITQDNPAGAAAPVQRGNIGGELDPSMTLGGNNFYDVFQSYEDFSNWHWPAALTFGEGDNLSTVPY